MKKLNLFRWLAFAEGASYLILLGIAMPLKYLFHNPEPVRMVGMAHGILFLLYVYFLFDVGLGLGWRKRTLAYGLLASVLPFGPFWFELVYLKGKNEEPAH